MSGKTLHMSQKTICISFHFYTFSPSRLRIKSSTADQATYNMGPSYVIHSLPLNKLARNKVKVSSKYQSKKRKLPSIEVVGL